MFLEARLYFFIFLGLERIRMAQTLSGAVHVPVRSLDKHKPFVSGELVKGQALPVSIGKYAKRAFVASLVLFLGAFFMTQSVDPGVVERNIDWSPRIHYLEMSHSVVP